LFAWFIAKPKPVTLWVYFPVTRYLSLQEQSFSCETKLFALLFYFYLPVGHSRPMWLNFYKISKMIMMLTKGLPYEMWMAESILRKGANKLSGE
jgi:hypothetical protein